MSKTTAQDLDTSNFIAKIPACSSPCTKSIVLNTGYNPASNSALSPGTTDYYWRITASTCALPGYTIPGNTIAITKHPSYLVPAALSNWISYGSNYNLGGSCDITIDRVFYVNQATTLSGTLKIACDNGSTWELRNQANSIIAQGSYPAAGTANFKQYKTFTIPSLNANCGRYTLRIILKNSSEVTALNAVCTINSSNQALSNSNGCCLRCSLN